MSFSNQVVRPIDPHKPHIVKLYGLYRVSPYNNKKLWTLGVGGLWIKAHAYVNQQNEIIRAEEQAAKARQREWKRKQNHCPLCDAMLSFTHRNGVSVCKCDDVMCPASERWLEPEFLQEYYK